MAHLLHIETATTNCSVALSHNGNLVHCIENNEADFRHSDHLHTIIKQLLDQVSIKPFQLSGVAVSKGPGSYTGLRIGVSTAKGLCYAHDLPLISVNSLEVLAAAYTPETSDLLIPMFDARRMEVFTMVLNAKKEVVSPTRTEIITSDSFKELRDQGRLVLFGNGSNKCKGIIPEENTYFVDSLKEPSAQHMVVTATNKFEAKQFEGTAYFEPFYLKDFYTNPPKV
jgi:tRNA threonylcarbamoyladenosine biosynthesis protein TsaB